MQCPVCNTDDTSVADSRIAGDGMSIRRRRQCGRCNFRFSTIEEVQILDLTVVKRNGRREPYSREKIIRGVDRALEKRPMTREERRNIIRAIEVAIQKLRSAEVTATQIGEIVMATLKKHDDIAYIRFASVYRQFTDLKTFQEELAGLLKKGKGTRRTKIRSKKSSRRRIA